MGAAADCAPQRGLPFPRLLHGANGRGESLRRKLRFRAGFCSESDVRHNALRTVGAGGERAGGRDHAPRLSRRPDQLRPLDKRTQKDHARKGLRFRVGGDAALVGRCYGRADQPRRLVRGGVRERRACARLRVQRRHARGADGGRLALSACAAPRVRVRRERQPRARGGRGGERHQGGDARRERHRRGEDHGGVARGVRDGARRRKRLRGSEAV